MQYSAAWNMTVPGDPRPGAHVRGASHFDGRCQRGAPCPVIAGLPGESAGDAQSGPLAQHGIFQDPKTQQ